MKTILRSIAIALVATQIAGAQAAPAAAGSIVRAQFTSAVKDRAPSDSLTSATAGMTEVSFYTELKGLNGTKVTHKWEHDGKVVREQTFDIGGDRWRVWSNKTLHGGGDWKVTVVDGSGATLGSYTLSAGK